mgnify:CR=1 FL=1
MLLTILFIKTRIATTLKSTQKKVVLWNINNKHEYCHYCMFIALRCIWLTSSFNVTRFNFPRDIWHRLITLLLYFRQNSSLVANEIRADTLAPAKTSPIDRIPRATLLQESGPWQRDNNDVVIIPPRQLIHSINHSVRQVVAEMPIMCAVNYDNAKIVSSNNRKLIRLIKKWNWR